MTTGSPTYWSEGLRCVYSYLHAEQVNCLRHFHQLVFSHLAGAVSLLQDATQLLFLSHQQRATALQQDNLFSQLTERVELFIQLQLLFLHLHSSKQSVTVTVGLNTKAFH